MALKAILDNLEGLPDDVKSEYKAGTGDLAGKFLLDVTPVSDFALENVKGLKTALSSERTSRETLEKQVSVFKDIDPDKAREAIKKVGEMKDWKPDDKVREQIEATTNQLVEKHKGEIAGKDTNIAGLTKQLEKNMITATATQSIAGLKGSPELLLPHVERSTRMRQTENGQFVVEVVGSDGNPRISPAAGSTAPMTIDELVGEMKNNDTFAPAFAGSGASGSGSSGSGDNGGNQNAEALAKLSPTERLKQFRRNEAEK
ncbi:MAG: hypothetical protein KAS32_15940 [Candidatus Peribacteraceae bacterium]|nr:hypothetical protein [Candidatus Peribacteraceae bacterium]